MAKHRAPRFTRTAPLPAYWLRDTTGEFHASDSSVFGVALCGTELRSWESRQTRHSKKCTDCLDRLASPTPAH